MGGIPGLSIEDVVIGDVSSRLSTAIFLLLCVVPMFATVLFGAVDNTTWIIITMFWLAIVLLWFGEAWKGGGMLLNTSPLQLPLIGLFAIGLIQLLPIAGGSAPDANISVSRAISMDPYATRFFLARLAVYIVFFAACLTFINHERRLKRAVLFVIIFGALMAFFGIMQRLANPDGIYGLRGTPQSIPFGPFVNQHHFAAFMQMTAGAALGLLFGKRTTRDKRILLAIAVVVMGVATVLTSSRGGLLGFMSTLAFVTVLSFLSGRWSAKQGGGETVSIQRNVAMGAGAVAIVAVIFGVVLFIGGNDSLMRGIGAGTENDISNGRAHFWPIALKIFFEHPIIGAGFDSFGAAFSKFDTWNGMLRVEQAHNDYLQTLADSGLAGFACIAAFIFLLFRKGLAAVTSGRTGFRKDAAVGALAGCFGILIHSFFDFPLRTPSNVFFFLMIAAIAVVPVRSPKVDDAGHTRRSRHISEP